MRRLALAAVLTVLLLTGCRDSGRDILWYQSMDAVIDGELTTDTGKFAVRITLVSDNDEEGDDDVNAAYGGKIEFLYPEELCGVEVLFSDGVVYMVADGVKFPYHSYAAGGFYEIIGLFRLDESSLVSVSCDGVRSTAVFDGEKRMRVDFGEDSLPERIYAEDGSIDFKVESYNVADE